MTFLSYFRTTLLLSLGLAVVTAPAQADEAAGLQVQQIAVQPANAAEAAKRRGLETIVKVELSFLNRVVDLSDKQRSYVVAAGKAFIEEELKADPAANEPQIRRVTRAGVRSFDAERRELEKALQERIHKLLNDQQWSTYSQEIEDRTHFEQQVVVDCFVSALDMRLNMNQEQRDAVSEVIRNEYADQLPDLQTVLNYGRYLPAFNLQKMEKCLDDDQRQILNSIQRVTYGSGNTLANDRNFIVEDINLE